MIAPRLPFSYAQQPFIVIWEATRACDLACAHCRATAQPNADPAELNDDEVRTMMARIREAFGPVLFVVTGGDPLKRPGLLDLIAYGASIGLRMAITPSATPLLTRDAICSLQQAGIQRMALSLDGADAATHDSFRGVAGTWERTLSALSIAKDIGLDRQLNSSIGRHNRDQLEAIADIASWYEISLWAVFILVPTGRAQRDMLLSPLEHERIYRSLAHLAINPETSFDIKTTAGQAYYRVRQQVMRAAGMDAPTSVTLGRGGMRAPGGVNDGSGLLFIAHTGAIQPSGFLPLTCGNVRTDDLAETYRTHPIFTRLRDKAAFSGKCGQCEFAEVCGGSRGRSYALTGDAFGSDPTCLYQPRTCEKT